MYSLENKKASLAMFGLNKKHKKSKNDSNEGVFTGAVKQQKQSTTKKSSNVPDLICKSFADGCLVLGCVHETTSSELIVSLPGIGNFGHVKLNNISKVYTNALKSDDSNNDVHSLADMYTRGDYVRCKVLGYSDRRLNLTMEPDLVNAGLSTFTIERGTVVSGAVRTREDHGYTIDLGLGDSVTAFVRTDAKNLSVGQCCLFKVESSKGRALTLSVCQGGGGLEVYDVVNSHQFDAYLPGARLLNCTIERVGKNGLQVNVTKQITGYVHVNHLPAAKRASLVKSSASLTDAKAYSNGDKISATILFVNPYSRVVYLSLLPHLCDPSTKSPRVAQLLFNNNDNESSPLRLGQVIESAQVSMINQKGVFVKFKLDGDSKQITGFVPKKHLFDDQESQGANDNDDDDDDDEEKDKVNGQKLKKIKKDPNNMTREDLAKHFPLMSALPRPSRIYDYNLIEDMLLLSTRRSVLAAGCLTYDELRAGQVVSCEVVSVNAENGGVAVKMSEFVRGFIPRAHTGDVPLVDDALLRKKMKPGTSLKCRVVSCDAHEKRCIVTAKKTLVKSKLPLIVDFDTDVKIGMQTYGVVVSIKDYGVLLGFFNDLKGLLPRDQISKSLPKSQSLAEIYSIGQLVKCRVLDFDSEKKLIKLSLLMDNKNEDEVDSSTNAKKQKTDASTTTKAAANKQKDTEAVEMDYEVGEMVEWATVLDANDKTGFFRLKLARGSHSGLIHKSHLSDVLELNDALFDFYKQVKFMRNLLVVNKQTTFDQIGVRTKISRTSITLSLKSSLIDMYVNSTTTTIPKSFEELTSNTWFHGWTRKVLPNGVLVEILNNLAGFCSNEKIAYLDELKAATTTANGLVEGQSVLVKIGQLFEDKKRFTASLKTRFDALTSIDTDVGFMVHVLKSCFVNTARLFKHYAEPKSGPTATASFWENAARKVEIGKIVRVAVKSYNESSGRLECLFMNDIEQNGFSQKTDLIGYAYVDEAGEVHHNHPQQPHHYKPGEQLEALVAGFDPITRSFCLIVDKEKSRAHKKNFDASFRAKTACRVDQELKAEVLYVSEWFVMVGLKQHAKGRLALMPLFKNDFTRLNSFRAVEDVVESSASSDSQLKLDRKIKQKQLITVSAAQMASGESVKKSEKRFAYFGVGETIKVRVKDNTADAVDSDLVYLIVKHDETGVKENKKLLMRHLAVLNESRASAEKRKAAELASNNNNDDNDDETGVVKKKVLVNGERATQGMKRKAEGGNEKKADEDSLEVVASVKKPKLSEIVVAAASESVKTTTVTHANGGGKASHDDGFVFPWEVNDFDQFHAIVSRETAITNQNGVDDNSSSKKKANNNNKDKNKIVDDRLIYENEEQVFNPNREPENSDDYERLLASKPNCSLLWIKYMVFYLQMAEIEKARGVAQQALKTILYKEEAERLNVWVALLNLENMYGTQTSLDETFNKATQNCDSFKTHCHMAEIYARSSKLQEAESIFMKMIRKFSKSSEAWIKYGIFHYKNGNFDAARKLLIRSFNSLDKKDHIDMVNKFAQLEFKYGDVERGKTMYDSLLFTYQNRTDIWSVYIDMLVKHEKYDDARQIFNRIIQMGLTSKRMKFIFKKFLEFEKAHGNDESVEKVREQAAKYVEKSLSSSVAPPSGDHDDDDDDEDGGSKDRVRNGNAHAGKQIAENLKKNLKL